MDARDPGHDHRRVTVEVTCTVGMIANDLCRLASPNIAEAVAVPDRRVLRTSVELSHMIAKNAHHGHPPTRSLQRAHDRDQIRVRLTSLRGHARTRRCEEPTGVARVHWEETMNQRDAGDVHLLLRLGPMLMRVKQDTPAEDAVKGASHNVVDIPLTKTRVPNAIDQRLLVQNDAGRDLETLASPAQLL